MFFVRDFARHAARRAAADDGKRLSRDATRIAVVSRLCSGDSLCNCILDALIINDDFSILGMFTCLLM